MSGWVVFGALVLVAWGLLHGRWGTEAPAGTPTLQARGGTPASPASRTRASPRLSGTLSIHGTVVDLHGTPMAGVRVTASWPEPGQTLSGLPCPESTREPHQDPRDPSTRNRKLPDCVYGMADVIIDLVRAREGEAPLHGEATTGPDGTFVLEGLPEGPQMLWALGERGAAVRSGVPSGAQGVELVLQPGIQVAGTVLGGDEPLAGATVTVVSLDSSTRFFDTTSGADGRFRVGPLPRDPYLILIEKEGWFPVLTDTRDGTMIHLRRSSRLSGRVVSQGAPVPGAEVRVSEGNGIPRDDARRLTADAQGRFTLELPAVAHTLSAARDGRYALARVAEGDASPEVVLELGSALHVDGLVTDESGRPVAGATVKMHTNEKYITTLKTVSGEDGRFRVGPAEPMTWDFTVGAPGHIYLEFIEPQEVTSGMAPVRLVLTRAASVSGRITDAEGHPLAGLPLQSVRPVEPTEDAPGKEEPQDRTWTDEEGRFSIDVSEPGDYRIDVRDTPFIDASFPVRAPAKDVHLTLKRGASVAGTVVESNGLPLRGCFVELLVLHEDDTASLKRAGSTDEQGRFLIQGVEPGRYRLMATQEVPGVTRQTWREVELKEGPRAQVELRLAPERTLSGTVVDVAGKPVEGAYVRARALEASEEGPSWRRGRRGNRYHGPEGYETGPDGRFTLRGLTEAEYVLSAWLNHHVFAPERSTGGTPGEKDGLRVGAGTTEVRLVLQREPVITGRVVGSDGAPVTRFRVHGHPMEDPGGAFTLPLPRLDSETLIIQAEGLPPRLLELPTSKGDVVDLGVVRLGGGRRLRGRVLDAETSAPVDTALFTLFDRAADPEVAPQYPHVILVGEAEEDGVFDLPAVDLEAFDLVVHAPEYLGQQLTPAPEQEELTVRLDPGARVEVTVKDRRGRLLATHIEFEGDEGFRVLSTASQGRRVQRGLPPDTYTVSLDGEGFDARRFPDFPPQRVVVPAKGTVRVLFQEKE
ncbi:carboxypeptidase regulatory-like domain-containing protein [Pyxidicoccus fallax]|uniref:Carboxypeptidase regulatory-like domain-containing protein n=1 Tax=Pyxidicoccus fallax TaxID=394095 RepID=A0A848LFY3_9BACT|nr:carboxypeptidase-like regulatory domain-containing protein [Pyxidicoccus fallax]NMO15301.1 carboxypeptidase regulatory-like domain-containing protein [Pyxidicoccus fallax]NPC78421.1 carboxypeptidase regulatory-like domain-containing protein [Pyxidicoccus fallax]